MKIFSTEDFESRAGLVKEYTLNHAQNGDVSPAECYIHAEGDVSITAEGELINGLVCPLSMMNINTYEDTAEIDDEGVYLIMTTPYQKIRLTFGGTAKVNVKIII